MIFFYLLYYHYSKQCILEYTILLKIKQPWIVSPDFDWIFLF